MFSFGKKKREPKKRPTNRPPNANKSPFDDFGVGPQPDDEELEAELQAITGFQGSIDSPVIGEDDSDVEAELLKLIGAGKSKKTSKKIEKEIPPLKDINPDAFSGSIEIGDDDVDVDENDPELLNELLELTNPEEEMPDEDESSETEDSSSKEELNVLMILNERLEMYKTAERKAKENNESSRARRFTRGIKTIQDLIKQAEKGQQILMGDIPPLIATNLKPPPPKSEIAEEQAENVVNQSDGDHNHDQEQKKGKSPDVRFDSNLKNEEVKPKPKPKPERSVNSDTKNISDVKKLENENIKNIPETDIKPQVPPKERPKLHIPEPVKPEVPPRQTPKLNPVNIPDNSKKSIPTDSPLLTSLKSQREEYKLLALKAKKNNDLQSALEHVKKVKEITAKITAIENGESVKQETSTSLPSPTKAGKPVPNISPKRKPTSPGTSSAPSTSIILDAPKTVLEALEQRLRIYNDLLQKCEKQNDKIAALKNRKIVQIYIDAIRLHKMGKKIPLEKLPTPPGCPPIPMVFGFS